MKLVLIIILAILLNYFIIINIVDIILVGPLRFRFYKKTGKNILLQKPNRIDLQSHNECSCYSSAYVMRHIGMEADGLSLYDEIPYKMKGGYVYPKGIPALLKKYNIKCKYCRGNLNSLRYELSQDIPVIVLIRYKAKKPWLHYVPVVGIDDKYVYIAESAKDLINVDNNATYNRRISIKDFSELWNTRMLKMPCYKNTYFHITV